MSILLPVLLVLAGSAHALEASVSGYVKLDTTLDLDSALDQGQFGGDLFLEAPPLDGSPQEGVDGGLAMHARQSRLRVTTKGEVDGTPVRSHLEGDFFNVGDPNGNPVISNSRELRLRHAYFTMGPWLFGQTWTLFMSDLNWVPETADFTGPTGIPFLRQAQVRLTLPWQGGRFAVSLENPTTLVIYDLSPNLTGGQFHQGDMLPDIIGHLNFNGGWGEVSILGVSRQLRVTSADGTFDETASTAALGVAGKFSIGAKSNIKYGLWSGELGRYTLDNVTGRVPGLGGGSILGDAIVTAAGSVEAYDSTSAIASIQLWWSDTTRSTLSLGTKSLDVPAEVEAATAASGGAVVENLQSIHVNFFWSPLPSTNLGLEWINKSVETNRAPTGLLGAAATDSGSASRLQFAAQYNF